MKPKLFVSFSVAGLAVAEAVKWHLSKDNELHLGTGLFNVSRPPFHRFTENLNEFDSGIFILTPKDFAGTQEGIHTQEIISC